MKKTLGLLAVLVMALTLILPTVFVPGPSLTYAQEEATPMPTPTALRLRGKPDTAVASYFRALVTKSRRRVAAAVCTGWRERANTQVDGFGGVVPSLSKLSCTVSSQEGTTAVVTCTGEIIVNYNGNKRSLDLAARIYRAEAENGVWKMCGYAD